MKFLYVEKICIKIHLDIIRRHIIVWSVQCFGELRCFLRQEIGKARSKYGILVFGSQKMEHHQLDLTFASDHGPCESGTRHQRITCLQTCTKRSLAKMPTRESVDISSKKCVANSDPRNRSFYIQVPKNLGRAAPLLIALHAQGFTADSRSASNLRCYKICGTRFSHSFPAQ